MGREIRKVSKDWNHPKANGRYVPLREGTYAEDLKNWTEEEGQWAKGFRRGYSDPQHFVPIEDHYRNDSFIEWYGDKPNPVDYMPEWTDEEKTHIQMYETCSEGTPISPIMDNPEDLARWLTDNDASAFGRIRLDYAGWLRVTRGGFGRQAVCAKEENP